MLRQAMRGLILACVLSIYAVPGFAAQYAALVMDARNGEIIYSQNADTKLHPASLTKMMTLYVVFDEIRRGRLSLDQKVTISSNASRKPPSRLGLKAGQVIEIRMLIRAAAVKSANDAAAALAEAVSGTEDAFAIKMTEMARAMGMTKTTFANASGLTQPGNLSTARDMALLGRHLFYDFPQYYNLFSRRTTSVGSRTVYNTNRRLLSDYEGADGIKTGYTNAAGFNLVASARRGQEHVIAVVFGGTSSSNRNAKVAELLDMGFRKLPSRVAIVRPDPLRLPVHTADAVVVARGAPEKSVVPILRTNTPLIEVTRASTLVTEAILEATTHPVVAASPLDVAAPVPATKPIENAYAPAPRIAAAEPPPVTLPQIMTPAQHTRDPIAALIASAQDTLPNVSATAPTPAVVATQTAPVTLRPRLRPDGIIVLQPSSTQALTVAASVITPQPVAAAPQQIAVAREWAVQLGAYRSRGEAERLLLTTALQEMQALEAGKREIDATTRDGVTLYRARFVGLTQAEAENACARLTARAADCLPIQPGI